MNISQKEFNSVTQPAITYQLTHLYLILILKQNLSVVTFMSEDVNSIPSYYNNKYSHPEPINQSIESDMSEHAKKYKQQLILNEEIRNNIHMVKTPIQKLQEIPLCRLDVGVCESFLEQFRMMCVKISYVLVPRSDSKAYRLRNWDLWGPFFFLVLFVFFIDNTNQVLIIMITMMLGAYLVTYNVIALGGKVSFFQSFSILNYCIFPIFMGIFIQKILFFFQIQNRIFSFSIMGAAVIWSCLSVYVFIGVNVSQNKKFIAVYPALLYYLYVGILLAFM